VEIIEVMIIEINIAVVSTAEVVIEEIFMVNISMEVTRVEISIKKRWRNQEGRTQYTENASSEGGAGNPYTFFA
jgi:hypothetical protein